MFVMVANENMFPRQTIPGDMMSAVRTFPRKQVSRRGEILDLGQGLIESSHFLADILFQASATCAASHIHSFDIVNYYQRYPLFTATMKRTRSKSAVDPQGSVVVLEDRAPSERQIPRDTASGFITPPIEGGRRPSKLRRHGSKLMAALRSLTNSSK